MSVETTEAFTHWEQRTSPRFAALGEVCGSSLIDWALHIDPEGRFVYFDNPKVASGTVKRSLWALVDPRRDPETTNVHYEYESPLLRAPQISERDLEELLFGAGTFRFGFVREPLSRVLSAYLNKIADPRGPERAIYWDNREPSTNRDRLAWKQSVGFRRRRQRMLEALGRNPQRWVEDDISFVEFLRLQMGQEMREVNIHWRLQCLNLPIEHIEMSFVGRFENLNEDLSDVLNRFGGARIESELRYATSSTEKAVDHVDDEARYLASALYAEDYRLFGYPKPI